MGKMKRTAVVTGAAKGIGKAIAMRLVNDGYFVVLTDVDEAEGKNTEREIGSSKSLFVSCDISKEPQVLALFYKVLKISKKIDVLVNNAGVIRDNLIWNMSAEDFDKVISINLRGTWLMCREAAKVMKEQKSGRIVNIASRAWLGNPGQTNYSSSKAGVVGLTRSLALELGRYGVLVNAVAPGLIDTPLTQSLKPEVKQKLIEAQPTKTIGTPGDVAEAVAFLASGKTGFITGQTIYVDGGKSIGAGM